MQGFAEFEFDLPSALLERLIGVIASIEPAPLVQSSLDALPDAQGVYVLLHEGRIVYVGKTDAEAGLRARLLRHARRVQHRTGLVPEAVQFKAVRIYVFTAIDLETQLIRHYGTPEWNNSGFGSNDPGRERDTTRLRDDGFDAKFPINVDTPLTTALPERGSASVILAALRTALPYTFRAERHAELNSPEIDLPTTARTAREIMTLVLSALPAGWQATALAGRIILYKENREYEAGVVIARSG